MGGNMNKHVIGRHFHKISFLVIVTLYLIIHTFIIDIPQWWLCI